MNQPHIVFFIGKPGSGKGTQAELLSLATGWPTYGTSAGLREIVAAGTAAGHKLQATMDAGVLTPYWVASHVFLKKLFSVTDDGSIIFDGTSRTLPEAEIVFDALTWLERPYHIFELKISDETVRQRIELRKKTSGRKDDDAIDKRLEEYYASTDKGISYLREKGALTELDGEKTPDEIAAEVRKILSLSTDGQLGQ